MINKVGGASAEALVGIREQIHENNVKAEVVEADLEILVDQPEAILGKRVLAVEDGSTLTHGEMSFGAGTLAARRFGAREIVDPRPFAVGSLAAAYLRFPHLGPVVPALGYSAHQCQELQQTIDRCGADVIVDASPCRLNRILDLNTRLVRVSYEFRQVSGPSLFESINSKISLARH